jgi:hypothetical protein
MTRKTLTFSQYSVAHLMVSFLIIFTTLPYTRSVSFNGMELNIFSYLVLYVLVLFIINLMFLFLPFLVINLIAKLVKINNNEFKQTKIFYSLLAVSQISILFLNISNIILKIDFYTFYITYYVGTNLLLLVSLFFTKKPVLNTELNNITQCIV